MQSLINFFGVNGLIPHGYCLTWSPGLLWLNVLSDALIVLAYYSIPLSLLYFVRKRSDLPYPWLFTLFGVFIVACGTTHLLSVITIWVPLYWLDGVVKAITAVVSIAAAMLMFWVIPRALNLRSPAQLEAEVQNKNQSLVLNIAALKQTEAALRISEERLKIATDSGQIGIWDLDLQTNELIWDDNMFAMYGVKREESSGAYDTWSTRLHPEDKVAAEAALQDAIAGIRDYDSEFRVIWPDGEIHYIKGRAKVIRDKAGKPVRVIGINWDNRAYAQTLQRLHLADAAINKSKSAFFWLNREGRVTNVNDYACKNLGYNREELVGQHISSIDPNFPTESWSAHWAENKKSEVRTFESIHRRKDGTIFPVEITTNRIDINGDEYSFSFVQDISERKRHEREMLKSQAIIESTDDGIISKTLEGIIESWNPAAEKIFGYRAEEVIGQPLQILIPPDRLHEEPEILARISRGERVSHFETVRRCKDGRMVDISTTISPIHDVDGKVIGASKIVRDISERKQMENQIRQLAYYDALTNVPNRRLLIDRLTQTIAASKRNGRYNALLFLDLDHFKPLNDMHGHDVGDLLLIEVASRLKKFVRESDTVARFGGDEFVVMLNQLDSDKAKSQAQIKVIAEKIRVALSEPYFLSINQEEGPCTTIEHRSSATIGVALFAGNEGNQEDVIKLADMAMYQAKKAGRNLIRFYELNV